MAQGKFKTQTKVPNQKQKQKQKGKAFTRRPNAPIQAKKHKFAEQQKLKQMVTKNVNKNVEQEIRQRATEGKLNLSKAQEAVAKFHKEKKSVAASASTSSSQ